MENKEKELYEVPTVMVVEIKCEGTILTVSGNRNLYDEEEI